MKLPTVAQIRKGMEAVAAAPPPLALDGFVDATPDLRIYVNTLRERMQAISEDHNAIAKALWTAGLQLGLEIGQVQNAKLLEALKAARMYIANNSPGHAARRGFLRAVDGVIAGSTHRERPETPDVQTDLRADKKKGNN